MASSNTLTLVNRVLGTTGDYGALLTLLNSPAGIAQRVTDFFNLVITDIEQASEWSELRVEATFTGAAGVSVFVLPTTVDVPPNGISAVWLVGGDLLDELNSPQFDKIKANNSSGAVPRYFRRGFDSALGTPTVEIFPVPPTGSTIKVSSYRRATKLLAATATGNSCEFDDGVLIYGALAHLDAYDGLDRGYHALYQTVLDKAVGANTRNTMKVPLGEYVKWNRKIPDAWKDPVFRDSYMKEHPEYLIP